MRLTAFILILASALGLFASPAQAEAQPAAAPDSGKRPNILWLVSEDNNPFLGCYGDKLAQTPTLDRLAEQGVLYLHCHANPVCATSRFALIAGLPAVTCGPAEHMRAKGKIPAWLKGFPTYLRQAGYFTSNNAKTDYNANFDIQQTWDECGKKAHWSHRQAGQPFFSVFNHEVTHESCLFPAGDFPQGQKPKVDPAAIRVPPYQPDTPEVRADWVRYYTCMKALDRQIAARLKQLADDGLADDTIVFYFGDNGGVLPRSKRFLQRSGTHVPLITYFPPKWRHLAPALPGARLAAPVSFEDFAPSVLKLAGVAPPAYMTGVPFAGADLPPPREFAFCTRDRMDERYDLLRSVLDRRFLYIRNYRPDRPHVHPLHYMFQARGYQSWARLAKTGKLTPATAQFWGDKPMEELYDCDADPDNVHNLADDPAQREQLVRLRHALRQRIITTFDNGFLPEGSPLEGYDASHAPGAYPVERVLAMAELASERKIENLPQLLNALNDPHEAVRWWAAQGCTMLKAQAAPAEAALVTRLSDASAAVQIAAAEALISLGKPAPALPVLERWLLQKEHPVDGLHAANVLGWMDEGARPLLPSLKRILAERSAAAPADLYSGYLMQLLQIIVANLDDRHLNTKMKSLGLTEFPVESAHGFATGWAAPATP